MSWPTVISPVRMKLPPNQRMQTIAVYITVWNAGRLSTAKRKVSVEASLSSVLTASNCSFS